MNKLLTTLFGEPKYAVGELVCVLQSLTTATVMKVSPTIRGYKYELDSDFGTYTYTKNNLTSLPHKIGDTFYHSKYHLKLNSYTVYDADTLKLNCTRLTKKKQPFKIKPEITLYFEPSKGSVK